MTTCVRIPDAKGPCSVTFPGGVAIEAMNAPGEGDFERGLALFRAMTPALAALAPVFTIIEAVMGLKKFVEAFTSFPPDLTLLAEGVEEFTKAVQKLTKIAPPVSVPFLIKDLLTCMISFLAGMLTLLQEVQRQKALIDAARARGIELDVPEMEDLLDCAEQNVTEYLEHVAFSMGSMSNLYAVMQSLADAAGIGDLLPGLDFAVADSDLDASIDRLSDFVLRLQEVLEAIP